MPPLRAVATAALPVVMNDNVAVLRRHGPSSGDAVLRLPGCAADSPSLVAAGLAGADGAVLPSTSTGIDCPLEMEEHSALRFRRTCGLSLGASAQRFRRACGLSLGVVARSLFGLCVI